MSQIELELPEIRSAPCTTADCKGGVGVPAWFWVDPEQWTPRAATATAGAFTVNVVAKPVSVTWDMGDGQSITCNGPGTAYARSMGWAKSPDCGSTWTRKGSYTLTATMSWQVSWTGAVTGGQVVTTTDTRPVDIAEYQVVITKP